MAEKYNISTVAVGGYKDIPLSYASFLGLQVSDFNDLIFELIDIGLLQNDSFADLVHAPFTASVTFLFTLKEIYDVDNPDDILEWWIKWVYCG